MMPKYYYRCNWCAEEWEEWGSMTDDRKVCVCARRITDFEKIPQPFTTTAGSFLSKQKVGDETKKGIEENREILKKMKKESRAAAFTADD